VQQEQRIRVRTALINHVLTTLGSDPLEVSGEPFQLDGYLSMLGYTRRSDTSVGYVIHPLSTLYPPEKPKPQGRALSGIPLSLSAAAVLNDPSSATPPVSTFEEDWSQLGDPIGRFESAAAMFRKHVWSVPAAFVEEEGVSLYEEFKLLAALAHASDGDPTCGSYTLIAGDFPGIQKTLFTISSQGAAKGLRGRSFFLQLLSDAVVRLLVGEKYLNLPSMNVIYVAGGNFLLLAGPNIEATTNSWGIGVNERLLRVFRGDVALVYATAEVPASSLRGSKFKQVREKLALDMGAVKLRQYVDNTVIGDWNLFEAWGDAVQCEVCRRQLDESDDISRIKDLREGERWRCRECQAFEGLSSDLARKPQYMSVGTRPPEKYHKWQRVLADVTDLWYAFPRDASEREADRLLVRLNDTEFLQVGADNFFFVAMHTPVVSTDDVNFLRQRYPDQVQNWARIREVRTFELLAENRMRSGIPRLGILRMDIDSLGSFFHDWFHDPSLSRLSAASAAISLFFDGWLNVILERVDALFPDTDDLYLIYAGGDDLFIVGAWDLLPTLAEEIQSDLRKYVRPNPNITISAGLTLEQAQFPLYRTAEVAKQALDARAKEYIHSDGHEKDAFDMLGMTAGWGDEWNLIVHYRDTLVSLISLPADAEKSVARSLLRHISEACRSYENGRNSEIEAERLRPDQIYYGKYHWMLTYSLTRLASRHEEHAHRILEIQRSMLSGGNIRLSGLASRWADYLTREAKGEE